MTHAARHDNLSPLALEVQKRRTFAIISHPDAGKTTLTEKLLLFGGAIHLAGEVKARGERRRARSDWMQIEQQRGISVSTSVMTFNYDERTYNLLDTPGHEDFSEDTYRTLTAVDSAIMVLDGAKGIETQTRKLFEVCRLRDLPIVTFVNKFDRECRDPLELMDEVSDQLALDCTPVTWPIGTGQDFRGLYDRSTGKIQLYSEADGTARPLTAYDIDSDRVREAIPADQLQQLRDDIELIEGACPEFDPEAFRDGTLTPVFVGSALKTFGIRAMLDAIGAYAPCPQPRQATQRLVEPEEEKVSGFIFKVQANMDKNHRDRVAFLRLCSGKFERGMRLHQLRTSKTLAVYNPIMFFAEDRELAETAYPGDIIGVPNHGVLRVGDSLSEGEVLSFTGIPDFAPEILRRVRLDDPMRSKHLSKALMDLSEEGVTQTFRPMIGAGFIVGVVGVLQLDVLKTRLSAEYKIPIEFEPAPFITARWVSGPKEDLEKMVETKKSSLAFDRDDGPVYMARNHWDLGRIQEDWPGLRFTGTRERA